MPPMFLSALFSFLINMLISAGPVDVPHSYKLDALADRGVTAVLNRAE